jgi:hypothetical protein
MGSPGNLPGPPGYQSGGTGGRIEGQTGAICRPALWRFGCGLL